MVMTGPGSLGAQAESPWGYLRSLPCLWNGLCAEASSDTCSGGLRLLAGEIWIQSGSHHTYTWGQREEGLVLLGGGLLKLDKGY